MDIYARYGDKVRFLAKNGYDGDQQNAKERGLKEGDILTVACTEVSSWSTRVYFTEYPNVSFNSVMFEDVENDPVVINLNELSLERIYDAYETRFGPLPDAMMSDDIISHVVDIIKNYKD